MNNFSDINYTILLQLNRDTQINFKPRIMNEAEILNVILSINRENHKLGFKEFLVIGNLKVIAWIFTDFENSFISFESEF